MLIPMSLSSAWKSCPNIAVFCRMPSCVIVAILSWHSADMAVSVSSSLLSSFDYVQYLTFFFCYYSWGFSLLMSVIYFLLVYYRRLHWVDILYTLILARFLNNICSTWHRVEHRLFYTSCLLEFWHHTYVLSWLDEICTPRQLNVINCFTDSSSTSLPFSGFLNMMRDFVFMVDIYKLTHSICIYWQYIWRMD